MTPIKGLQRIARERSRASVRDYWRTQKGFIAWCVMAVVIGVALIQAFEAASTAQQGVDEINEERRVRVDTQSSINAFFCRSNNTQDAILGKLVEISLQGAPAKPDLSKRQLHGLHVFQQVEQELRSPTNCHKLALELAKATGVNPADVKITPLLGVSVNSSPFKGERLRGASAQPHHVPTESASGSEPEPETSTQQPRTPDPHESGSQGGTTHSGGKHPESGGGGSGSEGGSVGSEEVSPTPAPAPAPAPSPTSPAPAESDRLPGAHITEALEELVCSKAPVSKLCPQG